MRLIFMGSPDFAIPSLQALLESEHDIVCVYTQPPRPAGRGQKMRNTPIHDLAQKHGLEVRTPKRLRNQALEELQATECDAIAVVAYGLLLPKGVLQHAPCLNVHPSALPRWRGPAPLQHTVLNGDPTTEVCIMQLDEGMDTGPVYRRESFAVGADETVGELHDRLSKEGGRMLRHVLDDFAHQTAQKQPEEGVCIAPKITPDMRPIDWAKPAQDVHNHIRGMSPFPSATSHHGETPLKILKSHLTQGSGKPGTILKAGKNDIVVACGEGAVCLTKLQRPGKQAMDAQAFLQGYPLHIGDSLL